MGKVLDFILLLLSQFAGGPGPVENNLVRFGLPAILWAILLYIAWSRQRAQDLPREKLLVWGFGLALIRELYMFGQMAYRLLGSNNVEASCDVIQPLEHGLAMAAMIVVAGAFLRYTFEDARIARRYLQFGLGITILVFVFTSWSWPRQLAAYPQIKFHQTWAAWLFHVPLSILMGVAIFLLWRKRGWLRNIVACALTFDLISEILLLLNYATARSYNYIICPIGNTLHILAIPLLGYVYLREQSLEKNKAEEALIAYRDHLEELVGERTTELTTVNTQLKQEISERALAEEALERITHRYELILESAGEGICGIDHRGRIVFANPAAAHILGYFPDELIGRSCESIWHKSPDNPHAQKDCPIYQGYRRGIQRYGDDEYFWRKNGTGFPVRYFSNPIQEKSRLAGAVVVFQDITERKRSEAEIAWRNASLATQNAVAATLSQSLEIDENLINVLKMVLVETEMEVGLIFLLSPDKQKLTLHLYSGLRSQDDARLLASEDCPYKRISRRALTRKQAVKANPSELIPAQQTACTDQDGIRKLVSTPLVYKGRAVGVLTLGTSQEMPVPAHTLDLLTAIGQQIGMAIENARLYKDSENWAAELTRLHEASSCLTASFDLKHVHAEIARQAAWLIRCSKAIVIHLDRTAGQCELTASFGLSQIEQQLWRVQLPEWALLSEIAFQGQTTAIQFSSTDMRLPETMRKMFPVKAALFTPIWSLENPQDFIVLLEEHSTRQWNAHEIELFESLANRSAVALVNANLHHQLEIAAALQERQRIAANMHDGLAQTLSLLGLRVDRMHDLVEEVANPETETAIIEIREAVSLAATEVRRSIASLQSAPQPQSSLQNMLHDLLRKLQDPAGPELEFNPGTLPPLFLPPDQTEQVMPLVQEAILNACHHANAQIVSIRLEKTGNLTRIAIEDDGCGFDPGALAPEADHFGLSIMQARAEHLGGIFMIDTSPGKGTRIILSWPYDLSAPGESDAPVLFTDSPIIIVEE